LASRAVGNVYFAGEQTNSHYAEEGFMEGAVLSEQDTAAAILGAIKKGTRAHAG
jgi:monoamine oxidase